MRWRMGGGVGFSGCGKRARAREGIRSVAWRARVLTAASSARQKRTPTLFDMDDFHTEVSSQRRRAGAFLRSCAAQGVFALLWVLASVFACLYILHACTDDQSSSRLALPPAGLISFSPSSLVQEDIQETRKMVEQQRQEKT